ncbi:hypothetical protein [Nocardia sp. NPDC050435]|uniref:hypothetical protein n=1 Tax=Nocardia sp. NPDC050435 TaxID=3155040 RepID=UPI0033C7A088
MSERSVEDEIYDETRKFSQSMQNAMRRYAQASNWLERRRARREISLITRQEAREQAQARQNDLVWTSQAVDRYRVHSQAVLARANDPNVDHERRARDARALREHRDDLAARFLDNHRLTSIEQGIALDGLDAATVFPEFETGNLYHRAHKVKGIEALRYRAHVARETAAQHDRWRVAMESAQRANIERDQIAKLESAAPQQDRYKAAVEWSSALKPGVVEGLHRSFPSERAAASWLGREIDHTLTFDGDKVEVKIWDAAGAEDPIYHDAGRPDHVAGWLRGHESQLRAQLLSPRRETTANTATPGQRSASDSRRAGEQRGRALGNAYNVKLAEAAQEPRREPDSLTQRLRLSIEHNSELADQNARLSKQVIALTAERDQAVTDRDAAVRKVVERTPAAQRYGSPERRAEEERRKAAATTHTTPREALKATAARVAEHELDLAEQDENDELQDLSRGGLSSHAAVRAYEERQQQRARQQANTATNREHAQATSQSNGHAFADLTGNAFAAATSADREGVDR